ncbi:CerR family C-terminal domain-containing protein [Mesorhizobium sp. CAU 1741]|uniref:CerR family C-terminal domain-containing protein n=1 Tax=Mesorhizobium sp. CAU 1741 TaxID=3140366 RepID=UPI00325C0584
MTQSPTPTAQYSGKGGSTRAALIEAGLRLFGEKGFASTSTREIAAAANANIGSIAYHFGGKEALRDACATHIVETMSKGAGLVLTLPLPGSPSEAQQQLRATIDRMAMFMLAGPEVGGFVRFILHELQYPTAALDIIYDGIFEPVHRRLCDVWAIAVGQEPESEEVKIAIFTMIGQLIYFRIGREAVLRRLGWTEIGAEEARRIAEQASRNMIAVIESSRKDTP